MADETPERLITIREFVEKAPRELELAVIAGSSALDTKFLDSERIQKLGLALGGFTRYIHKGRIQMIGMSEVSFLETMSPEQRTNSLAALDPAKISCILVTKGLEVPDGVTQFCEEGGIPLLRTHEVSSKVISQITEFLQYRLAPHVTQHGVLLEMFGIGVFIVGDSGIGKSESALDLITRRHRLVSDDVVEISKIGARLLGESPKLTYEHLEIHGLGIINIRELFGISSICDSMFIDLCIELKKWREVETIERIGLEARQRAIFDTPIPMFTIPVSPGRNMATIIETAVKVFLLRESGYDAAKELIEKHDKLLAAYDS
ncbi:MAG: HPr(Ser) kinase/phosphatase [Pyrinomonadaceae bacterium]|nr:HPr(Ser) kinase/phosphatase [Pyrinomonadaceae bacterium]